MQGTDYARPVEGAGWHNLPDTSLFPDEASFVEIEFEATDDLGWWYDIWNAEHVSRAWILGDLIQDRFF